MGCQTSKSDSNIGTNNLSIQHNGETFPLSCMYKVDSNTIRIKTVIIGAKYAGKTTYYQIMTGIGLSKEPLETTSIGNFCNIDTTEIKYQKYNVRIVLWDTPGEEQFASGARSYARDAGVIAIVINHETFEADLQFIKKFYLHDQMILENYSKTLFLVYLNKEDMIEDENLKMQHCEILNDLFKQLSNCVGRNLCYKITSTQFKYDKLDEAKRKAYMIDMVNALNELINNKVN